MKIFNIIRNKFDQIKSNTVSSEVIEIPPEVVPKLTWSYKIDGILTNPKSTQVILEDSWGNLRMNFDPSLFNKGETYKIRAIHGGTQLMSDLCSSIFYRVIEEDDEPVISWKLPIEYNPGEVTIKISNEIEGSTFCKRTCLLDKVIRSGKVTPYTPSCPSSVSILTPFLLIVFIGIISLIFLYRKKMMMIINRFKFKQLLKKNEESLSEVISTPKKVSPSIGERVYNVLTPKTYPPSSFESIPSSFDNPSNLSFTPKKKTVVTLHTDALSKTSRSIFDSGSKIISGLKSDAKKVSESIDIIKDGLEGNIKFEID